ncbi:MAG: hypothetical protein Q8Q30_01755 [Candidatus Woesebacteria bacterium]|nr:hypothetical protein [Candidatus Woesebacteria bacterium]
MNVEKHIFEEKEILEIVTDWFQKMDQSSKVGVIDPTKLNIVLDGLYGAMEIDETEEKSLAEYMRGASKRGMEAVWTKERLEDFEVWKEEWIADYEKVPENRPLPKGLKSGIKGKGMYDFFHQLSAFAYGVLSEDDFRKYTEVRLKNGKLWQEHRDDEREKIETPASDDPIRIGELPPGFLPDFWDWLKSAVEDE